MKYPANPIVLVLAEFSRTRLRSSAKSVERSLQIRQVSQGVRAEVQRGAHASVGSIHRGRLYHTGETVPESGIYAILHNDGLREPRLVTLIRGKEFSECEICRQTVSYRLIYSGTYIFHDQDFKKQE